MHSWMRICCLRLPPDLSAGCAWIAFIRSPGIARPIFPILTCLSLIHISGRMETNGDMVFEICDDGAGMAPQRLKALRQALADAETGVQTGEFFALRNVSARIALYYGADYGLTIDSQPGQGTRVRIRLPGKTGEGGDELVSDDDCGR